MQETMSSDQLVQARGETVYAADGDKIGSVEEVFVDEETGRPEWLGIGTGLLGTKRVLVPVLGLQQTGDGFQVPYAKEQVKETPDVDSDEIGQDLEARLYSHYGLGYSERESGSGLPEGEPSTSAPHGATVGEGDVVRSEEELRVGKRDVEAGRARIRKWVETEPAQVDVDLHRETARVTREPIEEPVSGGEIGEQEIEVPLRAEEAVVQKETIAKERVSLEKD